jgi:hypothetical protein
VKHEAGEAFDKSLPRTPFQDPSKGFGGDFCIISILSVQSFFLLKRFGGWGEFLFARAKRKRGRHLSPKGVLP